MAGTNDGHSNNLREAASEPPEGITSAKPSDSLSTKADRVTPPDHAIPMEINSPGGAPAIPLPGQAGQHRWRRRLLSAGALIALAAGVYYLIPWALTALNTVSTDDAYVNGHVTFVAPRVKGQVVRVLVDDNYRVRKGDILVQLDKQPYQVEVDRKKAALDIAQSKLVQARAAVNATAATGRALRHQMVNAVQQVRSQIQGLQADVATLARYQAALEDARKEYVRAEVLFRKGEATSREDFDQRRAVWLEAEASVRMAKENIRKTRAALSLPLEPPAGKQLGYVPPGLEQNHPTVLAALSQLVTLGAQLGLELPPNVETPEQLLKRFHVAQPEEYEKVIRQLIGPCSGQPRPLLHRCRSRDRWGGNRPQRESREQRPGGTKHDGRPLPHRDLDRCQLQRNTTGRPAHRPAGAL
jgi:membrane fusion protein (multidrug efflux system)